MSDIPSGQEAVPVRRFFPELGWAGYDAYLAALGAPAAGAAPPASRVELPRVARVVRPQGQAPSAQRERAAPAPSLLVLDVSGGAKVRLPPQGLYTLGRDPACTAALPHDGAASARHAEIRFHRGRYLLVDLGSTNGTWLNGSRIQAPEALSSGDCILVGRTEIRVYF